MAEFDPDQYLKEKNQSSGSSFDPDQYLKEKAPGYANKKDLYKINFDEKGHTKDLDMSNSEAESFLEGGQQSLSAHYLNDLRAKSEPLTTAILNKLTGNNVEPDDYLKARDYYNKYSDTQKKNNPGYYMGGEIALGIPAAMAIPQGKAAATVLGRVAQATKAGALFGGLQNPEEERGVIDPLQLKKRIENAGTGMVFGAGAQLAGEGIAKAAGAGIGLGKYFTPELKPNAAEIDAAAAAVGTKATAGMKDQNGLVERLESSLAESPSVWGQGVKKDINNVYRTGQKTIDGLTEGATTLTPSKLGENAKSGIFAKVSEDLAPSEMVMNEIADQTRNMPISERSSRSVQRNISQLDDVRLLGLKGRPREYVDAIGRAENVNDLKVLATKINEDIGAAEGAERQTLLAIKEKIRNMEEAHIERAALEMSKATGTQTPINEGQDVVESLRGARKDYSGKMQGYQELSDANRLGQNQGKAGFLDKIENIQSEKMGDKLFNLNNERGLNAMQEAFPEVYDLLKSGAIKDIRDLSQHMDKTSLAKFRKAFNDLNPEAQVRLFGQEGAAQAGNVNTLTENLPRNFNPSGTDSQSLYSREAIKAHFTDIPRYAYYKLLSSPKARSAAESLVRNSERMAKFSTENPKAFAALANSISTKDRSQENTDVIQNQNADKILQILGKNPDSINSIQDPRLRELLKTKLREGNIKEKVPIRDAQKDFIENN